MPIKVLDAATIGRIAAGEVVERPVSVVKELIENSLDAGATSITVEIREGGIEYLRVSDNGSGIAPNEARLAFENHATSKFSSEADISDIRTLGFRGEALSSVAAVSKVEMDTRLRGAPSGIKIKVEGSRFIDARECGTPEGTTIVIRDLFYNLPPRRAFLKKPSQEAGLITDLVTKLMLGNPNISIRLINNRKTTFHSHGDGQMAHAVMTVYGKEVASNILKVDEAEGGIRINGWMGIDGCAMATRGGQSFFINGRLVQCRLLTVVLEEACKSRVMIGKFPMCALNLILPPHSVDVNVHPTKMEVRFRDEEAVHQSVTALFEKALRTEHMLDPQQLAQPKPEASVFPEVRYSIEQNAQKQTKVEYKPTEVPSKPTEVHTKPTDVSKMSSKQKTLEMQRQIAQRAKEQAEAQLRFFGQQSKPTEPPSELREVAQFTPVTPVGTAAKPDDMVVIAEKREEKQMELPPMQIIGVAFHAYVFVQQGDSVLIIDQHAAHERILYEKYMKLFDAKSGMAQQLLAPMIIRVTKREYDLLMDNRDLLYDIGYEVEPFGEHDVQVRSVPHVLGQADLAPLFMSMLDRMDQLKGATVERRRMDIIKFACKRAVKAGDPLTTEEIQALLAEMQRSNAPPTCPHGRPVLKVMTKNEIEYMFKR